MHCPDDSKMNNAARATRSNVFWLKVKTLDVSFPVIETQIRVIKLRAIHSIHS